jgi:cation:H+ antiporter
MWIALALLVGLVLLVLGGDVLVRGATGIARVARVSDAVIGLTVVAWGTSLPELVVSLLSAVEGTPDLAVGNVVGSNIYNIALILGTSALVRALPVQGNSIRLEWPVMLLASAVLALFARDLLIDRLEGGFFLACMVAFTGWMVWISRRDITRQEKQELEQSAEDKAPDADPAHPHIGASIGWALLGFVLLVVGARALVWGAVELAQAAGLSERVIGLTVVAIGTSLPELFTSVMAAWRNNAAIAIGNVIGSNILNLMGILGTCALIVPLPVSPAMLSSDLPWMIGVAAVLLPLMAVGRQITRPRGALLVVGSAVYTGLLLAS